MGFNYTSLVSDPFTRANSADLGSDWTPVSGTLTITGNEAEPGTVNSFNAERWSGRSWTENHWAEVTVVNATLITAGTFNGAGVIVNAIGTGDFFFAIIDASDFKICWADIAFASAGTLTTTSFTPQAGDRVRLETRRVGSTVELIATIKRGGSVVATLGPVYADGSLDGVAVIPVDNKGGSPGIYSRVASGDSVGDGAVDDFEAGEIETVHGGTGGGLASWGELAWAEAPSAEAVENKTGSDTGSGAEAFTISVEVSLSDSGSGAEAFTISVELSLSDSGSGSEQLLVTDLRELSDSGSGTESFSISAEVPLSDSGSGAETQAISVEASLSDSGSGAETQAISASLELSDSGSGTDQIEVSVPISISDTGSGTEGTPSISVEASLSESGSGAEAQAISATLGLSDSGSGSDQIEISVPIGESDTGSGTEGAPSISVEAPLSESGSGAEAFSIGVNVEAPDSGTGADGQLISVTLGLADAGASVEQIDVNTGPPTEKSASDTGSFSEDLSIDRTEVPPGAAPRRRGPQRKPYFPPHIADELRDKPIFVEPILQTPLQEVELGDEAVATEAVSINAIVKAKPLHKELREVREEVEIRCKAWIGDALHNVRERLRISCEAGMSDRIASFERVRVKRTVVKVVDLDEEDDREALDIILGQFED